MKSDPKQNWCFESSSRYSGLPRCLPSSSRQLPRSSRRPSVRLVDAEFVSSTLQIESSSFCSTRGCRVGPSSSRRLSRSSRRPSVRLVATEFDSSSD